MMAVGLLLLIGIAVAVSLLVRSARERGTLGSGAPSPPAVVADLARWVEAGLLSQEQADAILVHEGTLAARPLPPPPPRLRGAPRHLSVVEPLGYMGGMLAIIGLVLLVAQYWPDMATAGRLALSGAGVLGFAGAGALVREGAAPALARLRWFLWLASSAATALFAGVLAADAFGADRAETVVAVCAAAVAVQSGLLWRWRERPLQQLTFLGGIVAFSGALVAEVASSGWVGVTVWALGAGFVLLGMQRRTPLPLLTEGTGAIALVVGAAVTTNDWYAFGSLLGVATAFALLAVSAVPGLAPGRGDIATTAVIGSVALVEAVPSAIGYFSERAGAVTGATTWLVGAALIFLGARRLVRAPVVAEALGATALLVGAAVTGTQWQDLAPVVGIVTAVGLIVVGMFPGQALLSLFGSVGLLVNVPWAIGRLFPGEGRAPLLVMVSGVLILAVALLLARLGPRLGRELGGRSSHRAPRRNLASHGM
jgi:hypothetical protein